MPDMNMGVMSIAMIAPIPTLTPTKSRIRMMGTTAIMTMITIASKLLFTVPDDVEYNLRNTLAGVSGLRGVASYSVPRFWLGDKNTNSESEQVLGIIHIVATRGSDLDDVKERTRAFLLSHGVDAVVQVENIGDASCWCRGNSGRSPNPSRFS